MSIKKTRLPKESVEFLGGRGGIHSIKKGKKAYDRKKTKNETRKELR